MVGLFNEKKIQSKEWGTEIRETVCFSIECCKKANQSNMIDWANQNKGTYHMEPMRKVKASKPPARMWETNYKSHLAEVLLLIGYVYDTTKKKSTLENLLTSVISLTSTVPNTLNSLSSCASVRCLAHTTYRRLLSVS